MLIVRTGLRGDNGTLTEGVKEGGVGGGRKRVLGTAVRVVFRTPVSGGSECLEVCVLCAARRLVLMVVTVVGAVVVVVMAVGVVMVVKGKTG